MIFFIFDNIQNLCRIIFQNQTTAKISAAKTIQLLASIHKNQCHKKECRNNWWFDELINLRCYISRLHWNIFNVLKNLFLTFSDDFWQFLTKSKFLPTLLRSAQSFCEVWWGPLTFCVKTFIFFVKIFFIIWKFFPNNFQHMPKFIWQLQT